MNNLRLCLFALLLALSTACGSVEAGSGEGGADAGLGDHTDDGDAGPDDPGDGPPAIVEVTPADGAGGVMPDAEIIVVFSRPMDAASVEAAWSSQLLPAGAVAFSWNASGDTLTVTPNDALPVAEGSGDESDSVEPIAIALAIGVGARDTDGNQLAEPLAVEFRTARRLSFAMPYLPSLSDCRISTGSVAESPTSLYAGDTFNNAQIKLVVSFPLPDLPPDAVVESATFSATQSDASPGIYDDFGDLGLVSIDFDQLGSSFAAAPLGSKRTFSTSGQSGARSAPVTRGVADAVAAGEVYAQFRLEFPIDSNNDDVYDIAPFLRSSLTLSLAYLVE